jgi:hypothetical protein
MADYDSDSEHDHRTGAEVDEVHMCGLDNSLRASYGLAGPDTEVTHCSRRESCDELHHHPIRPFLD